MKKEYKTDKQLNEELKEIYEKIKIVSNTRTKGFKQYEKYKKIGQKMKEFIILYEGAYE